VNDVKREVIRDKIRESAKKVLANSEKENERLISTQLQRMIPKILGFNCDRWDQDWEIDHCNGRAGESLLGDLLRKKVIADATKWVEKQKWVTPSKKEVEALKREYREVFNNRVRTFVRDEAERKATQYIDGILREVTEEIVREVTSEK